MTIFSYFFNLTFYKRNNAKILLIIFLCSHYYTIIFLIANSNFTKQKSIYKYIWISFIIIYLYMFIYIYIYSYIKNFLPGRILLFVPAFYAWINCHQSNIDVSVFVSCVIFHILSPLYC